MRNTKSPTSTDAVALKIYGERNTGTNYLTELLRQNLCADMLPGRVDDQDLRTKLTRRLRRFLPSTHGLHEAARDRFFDVTFSDNLGWKHMNPNVDRIGVDALSSVRFLMVVKNPYAWLLSFHKRPYHVGSNGLPFEEFLDRPMPLMEQRENIGPNPLSPVEIWNQKMKGYQVLKSAADHAMIVRYEDFLSDEAAAISSVADTLNIPLRNTRVTVDSGVKRDDQQVSHEDYASYYLHEKWRENISDTALRKINAALDADMVTQLGYSMISDVATPSE